MACYARLSARTIFRHMQFLIPGKKIYAMQVPNFFISRIYISTSSNSSSTVITNIDANIEKKFESKILEPQTATEKPDKEKSHTNPLLTTGKQFQDEQWDSNAERIADEQSMRNLKYSLWFMGISSIALGTFVVFKYGAPGQSETGGIIQDEFSTLPIWKQYALRVLKHAKFAMVLIQEPSRDKLLPDPLSYPYYQPPYTLVLEFTDVMVHPEWTYQSGWRFKKRPGIDYFLENLAGLYEIVVFTAEPGITIFPIIEALDEKGLISYKLVRDSTHFVDGHHVKNLDKLNRDLKKVIVIDWNSQSVKFHQDNQFLVKKWEGNDDDQTLIDLTGFLKTVATNSIEDVRDVLKYYKQFDDPLQTFRQKQIEFLESQQKNTEKTEKAVPSVKKLFDALL